MPLYLVSDGKGIAIVDSQDKVLAACDVLDVTFGCDPSELRATEIDLSECPNGVMIIRSFEDGTSQI